MLLAAATSGDIAWLSERTGYLPTRNARGLAAVDGSGRTRGVVGYDGWTQAAVHCHMAVDTPIAWRALLPEAFRYPLETCGRRLLIALVTADNARSLALARHFGFAETARIRGGWSDGVDLVLLELRKDDCRWLAGSRRAA